MYTVIELAINLEFAVPLPSPPPHQEPQAALAARGHQASQLLKLRREEPAHLGPGLTHFSQICAVVQEGA